MSKGEIKLDEVNIEKYINKDLLIVCTENQILIKENDKLKKECSKLAFENSILKKHLREISEYCRCILKSF